MVFAQRLNGFNCSKVHDQNIKIPLELQFTCTLTCTLSPCTPEYCRSEVPSWNSHIRTIIFTWIKNFRWTRYVPVTHKTIIEQLNVDSIYRTC